MEAVDPEEVPLHQQLEVMKLQCSAVYRNKHSENSVRDLFFTKLWALRST
jgi:hypothetical protein